MAYFVLFWFQSFFFLSLSGLCVLVCVCIGLDFFVAGCFWTVVSSLVMMILWCWLNGLEVVGDVGYWVFFVALKISVWKFEAVVDEFFRLMNFFAPSPFATQPPFIVANRQCEYVCEFSTFLNCQTIQHMKSGSSIFLLFKHCSSPKGYV
jgi:hypothetical protein